jgi:hypothetical protein
MSHSEAVSADVVFGEPCWVHVALVVSPSCEDLPVPPPHSFLIDADGLAVLKVHMRPLSILPRMNLVRVTLNQRSQVLILDAGKGERGHDPNIATPPACSGQQPRHRSDI